MTDHQVLQIELTKFGVSPRQAKIYLLLVEHKELRIQEIVRLSNVPRSSVYESLKGLFELGIAEEIVEDSFKKIRPYPIGTMRHGLDEKVLQLNRLKRDLVLLEKKLAISVEATVAPTVVRYYKGRSGARQLYWNTLKANTTVYVFSDWGRGRYVGMKFYERFVAESRDRQISEKVIINPTDHALESIRQYTFPDSPISRTRIEDIRAIDQKVIHIKGDTLMYDKVYANVYLKNVEIDGFEIESHQFVDTQRAIFETLWEIAKPIKDYL